jgi:hypothetical protein
MSKDFTREYTSVSTYPVVFDAALPNGQDGQLAQWLQVVGA